jgi:hypothetical protein
MADKTVIGRTEEEVTAIRRLNRGTFKAVCSSLVEIDTDERETENTVEYVIVLTLENLPTQHEITAMQALSKAIDVPIIFKKGAGIHALSEEDVVKLVEENLAKFESLPKVNDVYVATRETDLQVVVLLQLREELTPAERVTFEALSQELGIPFEIEVRGAITPL